MPIQTDNFNGSVVLGVEMTTLSQKRNNQHSPNANDHVHCMRSGHDPIEQQKQLDLWKLIGCETGSKKRGVAKVAAENESILIVIIVFVAFESQKTAAER